MSSIESMTAWVIDDYETDGFRRTVLPKPAPGEGEVLVAVRASAFNPIERKILSGQVRIAPPFPAILNGDVSGVVESVGAGVTDFAPGDEVFGCAGGFVHSQGALADYCTVRADCIAHAPKNLPLADAAVLPIAMISAWYALVDKMELKTGQRVLVLGGTGGVGHLGVQLAAALGADVYAACGTDEKCALACELGAHSAYNYRTIPPENVAEHFTAQQGFDAVFDTAGGESLANAFKVVRYGGKVVTIAGRGQHDLTPAHGKGISVHMVMMLNPFFTGSGWGHYGEILRETTQLVEAGSVRPLIDDERFTFDALSDAHHYATLGHHMGKILLEHPAAPLLV